MQYTINNNNIIHLRNTVLVEYIHTHYTMYNAVSDYCAVAQHRTEFTVSRVLSEHCCALKNGDVAASAIV